MADNSILQNVYYHYILENPMIAEKIEPDFFSPKILKSAFRVAKDYVLKYRSAPTLEQMKELIVINNMQDQVPDDLLDILYSQKSMLALYTESWLYDQVTNWGILEKMKSAIVSAAAYLKLNQESAENGNAKDVVEHMKNIFNQSSVIDFDEEISYGSDFWDADSHKISQMVRSSLGYDYIDWCLNGGAFPGCLICFAGAPKAGKSLILQNICLKSVLRGENSVYISLELPEEMVISRMGSNMFSIDSLEYDKVSNDTIMFRDKINKFKKSQLIKPGELIVKDAPTSMWSPIDVETYLIGLEQEKGIKIKNVFIDYINILRSSKYGSSENTYLIIKQLAEQLRAIGKKNQWAMITATQLNRSAFEASDVNTGQIAESAGLGATVDAMFALIADPLMVAQGKLYLKCLYTRLSPRANTKKLFNCDYKYLRITEDPSEGIIDTALVNPIQTQQKFIKGAAEMRSKNQQQFQPGALERPDAPEPTTFVPSTNLVDSSASPVPNTFSSPLFNVKGAGLFDNKPVEG
jgi:archaellum biogenesis ATPase FlaH